MARETKYSIRDLKKDFPSDEVCLDFLFETLHSKECCCGGTYSLVKGRKKYQCSRCRYQISPTAGTIFHKSSTPLTLWFHAIFIFSNAKSGISAKEMERQLGVTYKCAWRVLSLIRKALEQSSDKLDGEVEMDQAYIGGRKNAGPDNKHLGRAMRAKSPIMGAVQRGGQMRVKVVEDSSAFTHFDFLKEHIAVENTVLMTDYTNRLDTPAKNYHREKVKHGKGEYVRGNVHINTIETFFSHLKRSIKGTYKTVSKKHLQSYLDAFAFHYNNRHNDNRRFLVLLGILLHA